jgi:pimeloyl-ACP methyl ester carboxylesterase
VPSDPDALTFFARAGAMGPEEAAWAAVPYSYGEDTRRHHGERIAEDVERRILHNPSTLAYLHQVAAAAGHSANGRLVTITAPTLVLHGDQDRIMAPANGRALAESIPGAELRTWPAAGHLFVTDVPTADDEVAHFIARHATVAADRIAPPLSAQAGWA